jgi:hypothetical protein
MMEAGERGCQAEGRRFEPKASEPAERAQLYPIARLVYVKAPQCLARCGVSRVDARTRASTAGSLKATDLRDLRGVIDREKADIGVLRSFETPTNLMRTEAAPAGFYDSPWGKHPRLQLLTVTELPAGAAVDYPKTAGVNQIYKQAPWQVKKVAEQRDAFGDQS